MTYRSRRSIVGMKLGGRAGLLRLGFLLGVAALGLHILGGGPGRVLLSSQEPKPLPNPAAFYASLPLSFERNQGQTDQRVKFLARGLGYTLFLTSDEAVLALRSHQSSVVSGQLHTDRNSKFENRNSKFEARKSKRKNRKSAIANRKSPRPQSRVAQPSALSFQ